jgi:hypothetical protein
VQVDPIKPTLKAPGTKRLKLKHDAPLSNFAFKFKSRRYSEVAESGLEMRLLRSLGRQVGQCRLILSKPR